MAKQIYIDENGNENLVSGTINTADMLPIESGSATNTKSYIDSGLSGKADTTKTLNISVSSGYTINTYSGGKVDKLVGFSLSAKKTGGWTSGWHTIGVIAEKPSQTVYIPVVNATNGGAVGMAVVYDSSGNINIYTTLTGDIILGFTANYVTN